MATVGVQHRLVTVLLLSVSVLAGTVLCGGQLSAATPLSPGGAASGCAKVAFYGVRGSGDPNGNKEPMGPTITALATALQADLTAAVKVVTVPDAYPAVSVTDAIAHGYPGGINYLTSRADGIKDLGAALERQAAACPLTWTVLAGYSQGADVVATYLAGKVPAAVLGRIAGVGLLGDPRFNPKDYAVDVGSFNPKFGPLFERFWVPPQVPPSPEGPRPDISAALASRTVSVCNQGDPVCNYSWSNALGCFFDWKTVYEEIVTHKFKGVPALRSTCAHIHYLDTGPAHVTPGQKVTVTAVAQFLATQVRAAMKSRWGIAEEVPGIAALNTGGSAQVTSVSCGAAGNCAAGGYYNSSSTGQQAFVADEVNGTWGSATELPGTAALNADGSAQVASVSCGAAGNCAAGGDYNSSTGQQAFVADEVNGTWSSATEVPGTGALNTGGIAEITSVSCASAGDCTAGGYYSDTSTSQQAFVADEVNGTWNSATEVPGTSALNTGIAQVTSVSCGSAGNCTAGGYYVDSSSAQQAFVADEVNGTWGSAVEVPGTATLNAGGYAQVTSVSCASAGNCSAAGNYTDTSAHSQAFVADQVNGSWGSAVEVPGTATLSAVVSAKAISVSCASAGDCALAGNYYTGSLPRMYVANEVNGAWASAQEVPVASPNSGVAALASVACASAGNCTIGGAYGDIPSAQAFVADEVNGLWRSAIEVPGTAALNTGDNAQVTTVSCSRAGKCAAGGFYTDSSSGAGQQPFIVSQP